MPPLHTRPGKAKDSGGPCAKTGRHAGDIRKNYRLPAGPKTIGELPTGARQKSGAEKLKGHDIMAQENQEHPFVLVREIFYLVCKFLVVVSGAVLGVYQGGCNTRFV